MQAKARQQLELQKSTLEVLRQSAAEYPQQIQAVVGSGDAYQMTAQIPFIVQRLDITLRELTAYKTVVDMLTNILKLEV